MSDGSRSDSGCCLSDGVCRPYSTSAEHSRSSRSPLDNQRQPAALLRAMNSPPIQYLRDEQQGKSLKTRTVSRRHGACNPCKASKTKCDGAEPCGACRSEKRKSRICEYSEKARGIALARQEGELRRAYRHQSESTDSTEIDTHEYQFQSFTSHPSSPRQKAPFMSASSVMMHGRLSLCRVVDEFIKVKTARPQAQAHIRSVQSQWTELQKSFFNDCHNSSMSLALTMPSKKASAMDDDEHVDEHLGVLDRWRTEFNLINEKINNGNLTSAWVSIPPLIRTMEAWEIGYLHSPWEDRGDYFNEVASLCSRLLELDSILSFFLGSQSLLLSTWQRSNFLRPKIEHSDETKSRLELFQAIPQVFDVDVSNEPGIWDFLRLHKSIKAATPATLLEKVATCTTDKEPFGTQEMKLYSNLLFVMNYCRTSSICGHYSQNECPLPPASAISGDIVREMKLNSPRQRGNECTQANKHAGIAMRAFEALYDIDKETLAHSWLLLYGGLVATIIWQIHGLRETGVNWDTCKQKINRVQSCFSGLQEINPGMPLINKAITILSECDPKKSQSSNTPKPKTKPSLTRRVSTSFSDGSIEASELPMQKKSSTTGKPSSQNKRSIDEAAGVGSATRTKMRKTTKHKNRDLESTTSSFDGHDTTTEPRPMYGYSNTLHAETNSYEEDFASIFDEHAPFLSSANTSFGTNMPPSAALSESLPQGWYFTDNDPYPQWPIGHPPMVIPNPSPSLIPFALQYNGYDHLNHRWPRRFEGNVVMEFQQDSMPPPGSIQRPVPSPASLHQVQPAQQASDIGTSEGSTFFNKTAKHYNGKNAEATMGELIQQRNSQLLRPPSEPMVPTRDSMVTPGHWHDGREDGVVYPHEAEYQSAMLPPRPETLEWQSEQQGASSQTAYYPLHHQQFDGQHGLQYTTNDPSIHGQSDIHEIPQTQYHHFQNTTMPP